ncbi:hypothetical protein Tco_0211834 [Tanacetum coccineum]
MKSEEYCFDILYAVSIKEDTVYLCLHFTRNHEEIKIYTPPKPLQAVDCDIKHYYHFLCEGHPLKSYALVSNHQSRKELGKEFKFSCQETSLTKQKGALETLLENKEQLSATIAKRKVTCPNSAPNQRGKGMIRGLRIKCVVQASCKWSNFTLGELPFLVDTENSRRSSNIDCNYTHNMLILADAMPSSEQSNVVNHLETEITSDSNIIPYSQYLIDHKQNTIFSDRPTNVKVPKELPKSAWVDTSLKKLNTILLSLIVVVKEE